MGYLNVSFIPIHTFFSLKKWPDASTNNYDFPNILVKRLLAVIGRVSPQPLAPYRFLTTSPQRGGNFFFQFLDLFHTPLDSGERHYKSRA